MRVAMVVAVAGLMISCRPVVPVVISQVDAVVVSVPQDLSAWHARLVVCSSGMTKVLGALPPFVPVVVVNRKDHERIEPGDTVRFDLNFDWNEPDGDRVTHLRKVGAANAGAGFEGCPKP